MFYKLRSCLNLNRPAEDEEGCLEEYKTNGLVSPSAEFLCQSKTHNKKSPAILATIFDWTLRNSGSSWVESHVPNVLVIMEGVIVNILSTRCDGISECLYGKDEYGCGIKRWHNILAGNSYNSIYFVYSQILG